MLTCSTNQVFAFLDGKKYVLDGIAGTFKHVVREVRYPYARTEQKLTFNPSTKGKNTEAYRATRAALGDDWMSDLTDSIERYCEIATELGYQPN